MDVSDVSGVGVARLPVERRRAALRTFVRRKSTIAFLLTLPLLLIIALLVI